MTPNSSTLSGTVGIMPRPGQFSRITFRPTGDDNDTGTGDTGEDDDADEANEGDTSDGDETTPPKKPAQVSMDSKAFKKRIDAAKATAEKELLKKLGVESVEAATERLGKLSEIETANMSEVDRLKLENANLAKERDSFKDVARRTESEKKADDADRFLERTAEKFGADPEEMDITLAKLKKHIADTFGDDHEPTKEDVTSFLEELKVKKPSLFTAKEAPAGNGRKQDGKPPKTPNNDAPAKPVMEMTREEFIAYKRTNGITA